MSTPAPDAVKRLVDHFDQNRDAYHSVSYNEAQLRREFIDPLFEALGWDVENRQGSAMPYRDVIFEDSLKVGGATKAPDYCFRIGGMRKFFVEAKKPSVNIATDSGPAFQLRRYAWSAKLPLSILTDFEEFAVYDCRSRPVRTDKASTARIKLLRYSEYPDRWDELHSVFSPEAIRKGSFDKYVVDTKIRKGTAEVDDAFLAEIEGWRDSLARNIALRNPRLGTPDNTADLNLAVQMTIDRAIFLRICEDRGIEDYGTLQNLIGKPGVYRRLMDRFEDADKRYNSGLFDFRKDTVTPSLKIDDKLLSDIISELYPPKSPYEFSVIGIEILGEVYEQFLGKVIRLTAGHQAKVEEKPEVRKAGGVHYTPQYIVSYIVKNTIGKLIADKTPAEIAKLAFLDMSCGSGSFLIGGYTCLLDYHLDWYVKHDPAKRPNEVFAIRPGEYLLTTAEKKRILLNNIYGVDIDPQAVEVTKLSLLLKVLEGENKETINQTLRLFRERALPNLDSNIKCGNSLIDSDFYRGQQGGLFDADIRRVNAFDWHKAFPEVMARGGFDAVVGNPPYVRQESLSEFKDYFARRYEAFDGTADLYAYFMERSVKLLREGGRFSVIVSSSFLRTTYAEPLRRTLKKHAAVLSIVDFGGLAVFENAKDTYVCIPLLSKTKQLPRVEVARVPSLTVRDVDAYVQDNKYTVPHERLSAEAWALKPDEDAAVFAKIMTAGKPLGDYVGRRFFRGVTSGLNEAFVIDSETRRRLIGRDKRSVDLIKPVLCGEDVRRYFFRDRKQWLIFPRRGVDIDRYPAIREHLERWRDDLTPKRDKGAKRGRKPGNYKWYEIQDDVAYYEVFDGPKIIFPDIAKGPRFTLDTDRNYLTNTAYCLGTDDRYLLGILNSRLFWFVISNISIPFGVRAGEYRYRLIYQYMEKVPIRVIDSTNKRDKARHDKMVELVTRMMELKKQQARAPKKQSPSAKQLLDQKLAITDNQIDLLVYELYGLTEDEISVVEGGTR